MGKSTMSLSQRFTKIDLNDYLDYIRSPTWKEFLKETKVKNYSPIAAAIIKGNRFVLYQ